MKAGAGVWLMLLGEVVSSLETELPVLSPAAGGTRNLRMDSGSYLFSGRGQPRIIAVMASFLAASSPRMPIRGLAVFYHSSSIYTVSSYASTNSSNLIVQTPHRYATACDNHPTQNHMRTTDTFVHNNNKYSCHLLTWLVRIFSSQISSFYSFCVWLNEFLSCKILTADAVC